MSQLASTSLKEQRAEEFVWMRVSDLFSELAYTYCMHLHLVIYNEESVIEDLLSKNIIALVHITYCIPHIF